MRRLMKLFCKRDDGAVMIDWVVLAGSIIGLGIGVLTLVGDSTSDLAGDLDTELDSVATMVNGGQ